MKAVLLEKPWEVGVTEIEQRPPKAGEALLKIRSAGICGSDIGAFRGTNGLVSYPRIIGHELAGEVLSIPANNPKGIQVGDHVVVEPYMYCGSCYPCSIGRTNCCDNIRVLGVHADGGMAETFAHPAKWLVKVPEDMPWELIPIAEPLCIALHGVHRLKLKAGEFIAISGAGPIGLLVAMVALAYDANPILIDLVTERLEYARSIGVQYTVNLKTDSLAEKIAEYTHGNMAHCALEASGASSAIRSTLDIVCHAGRAAFTGWPHQETPIPTNLITFKELDLVGARNACQEFEEAVDLIYTGRVDARKILTKMISIDEAPATIRDIEKNPGKYMKVNVMF
ncbi:MAG: alcohol dehydrogenase catalytic domain-containing protein [Oscillospiraceae bacterium]|nr:alcohol dehydrogenase catalytic domain-containing protein [Oscillospiraceae bacterium]